MIEMGTKVGDDMQARARPGGWDTPCWSPTLDESGGVSPAEGQLLYGLVRSLRPVLVVEYGTGYGHATLHIAAALRDNGTGNLLTIEVHNDRRQAAVENIRNAGLDDVVTFDNAVPEELPPIGLLFLDAGHTYEDVLKYFNQVALSTPAVIVVHDAGYLDHAKALAKELRDKYEYVHLDTDSLFGMAILRRKT